MGLKNVFLCKEIKSVMYFDILIKIMLYKSIFSSPVSSKISSGGLILYLEMAKKCPPDFLAGYGKLGYR